MLPSHCHHWRCRLNRLSAAEAGSAFSVRDRSAPAMPMRRSRECMRIPFVVAVSIRLLERRREALAATAEAAVVQGDRHRRRVWLAAHGVLAADRHDLRAQVVGLRDGVERARAGPGVELRPRRRRDCGALAVVIGEAHLRADADLELPAGFLADGTEIAVTRELEEDA